MQEHDSLIHRVESPNYRYPPSRNPYWEKIRETSGRIRLDHESEKYSGLWKKTFSTTDAALHVELGCNGGHWLLARAALDPKDLFVGIDWKFKQVYLAHEKSQKHAVNNTVWLRAHAERMPMMFAAGEIDHLYLFFPDPWPKKAQRKNRLFDMTWLTNVAPLLRSGGTFEIRTDHGEYFAEMLSAVRARLEDWKIESVSRDHHGGAGTAANARKLAPPKVTLFERVFISQGVPIQRVVLKRN